MLRSYWNFWPLRSSISEACSRNAQGKRLARKTQFRHSCNWKRIIFATNSFQKLGSCKPHHWTIKTKLIVNMASSLFSSPNIFAKFGSGTCGLTLMWRNFELFPRKINSYYHKVHGMYIPFLHKVLLYGICFPSEG